MQTANSRTQEKLPSQSSSQDFPGAPVVKNPPANAGNMDVLPGPGNPSVLLATEWDRERMQVTLLVSSLGREEPLEEGTATHASDLSRKIPRTGEPGGLQSIGSHRVGHD